MKEKGGIKYDCELVRVVFLVGLIRFCCCRWWLIVLVALVVLVVPFSVVSRFLARWSLFVSFSLLPFFKQTTLLS